MSIRKVVIICPTFPPYPCGVGKHTQFLLRHLYKRPIRITLISSGNINADFSEIEKFGIAVNQDITGWCLQSLRQLVHILRQENPDIIHLEYPTKINGNKANIILLPILVRMLLHRPIVVTQHEFMDSSWKGKIRNVLLLLFASYVIFPNEVDQKLMIRLVPFLKQRSEVIPIGSTIETVATLPSPSNTFTIGYNGFLDPSKGFETLLHALPHLQMKDFQVLVLTRLDQQNPYHRRIVKLVDTLGLQHQVKFHSILTDADVSIGLQKCNVVVLPYNKGVTLKRSTVLDAFSHEIPVISTKTKYTPTVFHNGNIILVPPYDEKIIAKEIDELNDKPEKVVLLEQGMKKFMQRHDWDEIASKTALVYNKVI